MDELDLNSFLKLGYFLGYPDDLHPVDLSRVDRSRYEGWSEDELIREGTRLLREAISSLYVSGRDDVIPLSGGLDSRAILSVLRECTEASGLRTYTFGTPGTYDYEIGNRVAAHAGTLHTRLPLTEERYSAEELLDVSRRVRGQTFLLHHPPVWRIDALFGSGVIWSGYIGDYFVGSHRPERPSSTLQEARVRFVSEDRFVHSIELGSLPDARLAERVDVGGVAAGRIGMDEQLFLDNHIRMNTAPHVLLEGFEYRTPYLDGEWIGFAMSVPDEHRRGMALWKKILLALDPDLFSLPTKGNHGLPLTAERPRVLAARGLRRLRKALPGLPARTNPTLNYLDWNEAFRARDDLRELVRACLSALAARGIVEWIDVEELFRRHLRREGNFGDALVVLSSLELHLQAGSAPGGRLRADAGGRPRPDARGAESGAGGGGA